MTREVLLIDVIHINLKCIILTREKRQLVK